MQRAELPQATPDLPIEIGEAIAAHYFYQLYCGERLSNPVTDEDVQDVVNSAGHYAHVSPEAIAHFVPAIKLLMADFFAATATARTVDLSPAKQP